MSEENPYIASLTAFKKRKGMYISSENVDSVYIFLTGYVCAVMAEDSRKTFPNDLINKIGASRGWETSACGPINSIRNSKLSEQDKMDEVIDIFIECFRLNNEHRWFYGA